MLGRTRRWLPRGPLALGLCLTLACCVAAAGEPPAHDIPRLAGITVDGDPADWGERGFRVEVLPNDQGAFRPPDDLDARVRLGWDESGLLVLVTVRDQRAFESRRGDQLWSADSVELFLAPSATASEHVQYIVSPGRDPDFLEPRTQPFDYRDDRSQPMSADIALRETADGYVLEACLHWHSLGIAPEPGRVVGFQVFVNDADGASDWFQAIWAPRERAGAGCRAVHLLRLSDAASPPVRASAVGSLERMRRVRVGIAAAPELLGQLVEVHDPGGVVASGRLTEAAGRAGAELRMPIPPGAALPSLRVFVGEEALGVLELPDLAQARARAVVDLPFRFRPYVFSSATFPECDFVDSSLAEDLLGRYELRRTFYNADYEQVRTADEVGRYGAVVEVIPEAGRPLALFRTLFRAPEASNPGWHPRAAPLRAELSPLFGFDPRVLQEQASVINDVLWMQFSAGLERDQATAALMAGLAEAEPTGRPARVNDDALARDRQWWVGLKRKLYGAEERWPTPFVCPRPIVGPPAPKLREGTAEEAGMEPDTPARLDALLREWAADSDEGFAVCVARRGVVFLHQAYGEREHRPMAVTDKSWMASITKLLSGTLMMMLVDQGLVGLDDPVAEFLPAFRGVEVETPLTIRDLYVHTNGLWGHWGDELHDFDQLIASYYPYLEVGKRFDYNGAGYTLGGKVIEIVSGEAVPLFFKRHLLDPLGCESTDVFGTSWDARTTAMDLARIGQMLLNRGAYGEMRFFDEETFEQMLPRRLTQRLGPDTTVERGIGLHRFEGEPLGEAAFGHGAASATTLRIDPAHELVVVMARNSAGRNFEKYHHRFLAAVVEGIEAGAR